MKAVFGFVVILVVSLCSYGQSNRIIDWPPAASMDACVKGDGGRCIPSDSRALEIIWIKADDKLVVPGQQFAADGEWLKSFTVKIKNVSERPISSVRLHFGLLEAKTAFSLEYGKELSTGIDHGVQKPIAPGEEIELRRSDRHYARDKEGITKRTGIMDFNSVLIGVTTVQFLDGTVWWAYKLPMGMAETVRK